MNAQRIAVGLRSGSSRAVQSLVTKSKRSVGCLPRTTAVAIEVAHSFSWENYGRTFCSTSVVYKKGGKQAREEKNASQSSSSPSTEDLFDLSGLESEINTFLERLKSDLSKLRGGGRFNTELLENIRVKPDKAKPDSFKLNDLAQVIPKGRTVQILVGEKDHVKPITSSIQSSSLSLTPQPDPTGANPLLLIINIPPPTAESRKAAVAEAVKVGDEASTSLRDARGKQQKKFRALQSNKSARPDDVTKAMKKMEQVVEKGTAEMKKAIDNAKKVLESG